MSAPSSVVSVCSGVRLDARYTNSIYFADRESQERYFAGKVVRTFSACTYLRKTWPIQLQATMEQAKTWNYLFFRNGTGKTYYYFINQIEYKNESSVVLTLELDVLQTYLFDFTLLPSFLERQHVTDDLPGYWTEPEGLELGPYYSYHKFDQENIRDMGILVMCPIDLTRTATSDGAKVWMQRLDGVFSGLGVFAFNNPVHLGEILSYMSDVGSIDSIVSIWMYPKNLIKVGASSSDTPVTWDSYDWETKAVALVKGGTIATQELAGYANYKEYMFNGYTPKNNKLYCYPFNLLHVSNNVGEGADFHFEGFATVNPKFSMYSGISPDAGVKVAPDQYYGRGNAEYEQGLTLSNYPQCAWNSDTYKVWLAQNFNQLSHSMDSANMAVLGGAITAVGSLATQNYLGTAGGVAAMYAGYNQVQGIIAQKEDAKTMPPQARGTFSSSVNVAVGRQTFTYYYKSITWEYARTIDDYFTMYGYRINRVETPNLHARPAFTYVKTVGCNIQGNMCNEDILKVASIFDQGVTWWVNGDRIGDYSQDNTL